MKKRDLIIFALLIALVVVFTAWENIAKRQRETEMENMRRAERESLEARLAGYDLELDSLTTRVLRIVDSLKTEAAAFESLALSGQSPAGFRVGARAAGRVTTEEETVTPEETIEQAIQLEYERAIDDLPGDLTRYERKIAQKEVENTILAKYNLTLEEFNELKKTWSESP